MHIILFSILFASTRAIGTLGPPSLRPLLPLGFVLMAALPWLLLDRAGRRAMGLQRPVRWSSVALAVPAGATASLLCFGLGYALYGAGPDNWFVSIANTYRGIMDTSRFGLLQLHIMFTIPACLFSPIGEELFFRGYLQRALEQRFSPRTSTHLEAGQFGLVHICHHFVLGLSGLLWMGLMFGTAWLFAGLRQRSGSVYPAIAAHKAFNATMNLCIFAWLWH